MRTILSSTSQGAPRRKGEFGIGAVQGKARHLRIDGERTLSSVATRDKGKAAITAIKYSAPNRAMFFSFYNHPQLLWVWADRTSINPGKLNLHVDAGGRVKANIKGKGSNPERGGLGPGPRTRAS